MKNILLLIFCITFLIFAKCEKVGVEWEGEYFGSAKAEINGSIFYFNKLRGALKSNSMDSIYLGLLNWDGLILKNALSIGPLDSTIGIKQRLNRLNYSTPIIEHLSSTYSTLRDDGDVLCDFYHIFEPDSLQNFIIITYFNPQTKEIRGKFQATYLIDSNRVATIGKCRPDAPDTIRIKNGEFSTKIFL